MQAFWIWIAISVAAIVVLLTLLKDIQAWVRFVDGGFKSLEGSGSIGIQVSRVLQSPAARLVIVTVGMIVIWGQIAMLPIRPNLGLKVEHMLIVPVRDRRPLIVAVARIRNLGTPSVAHSFTGSVLPYGEDRFIDCSNVKPPPYVSHVYGNGMRLALHGSDGLIEKVNQNPIVSGGQQNGVLMFDCQRTREETGPGIDMGLLNDAGTRYKFSLKDAADHEIAIVREWHKEEDLPRYWPYGLKSGPIFPPIEGAPDVPNSVTPQ